MADGVFVDVHVEGFDGVIYVKGYSKDAQCRQVISNTQQNVAVPFRVLFNTCGLFPIDVSSQPPVTAGQFAARALRLSFLSFSC